MASAEERIATATAVEKGCVAATAVEKGMDSVVVTCLVEGLQVTTFGGKAKNGDVAVKISAQGFDMTAVIKNKDKETTFRKVVKKLPGALNTDNCQWKLERGKVLITLAKAKQESWAVQLSQRGLEQQSDDEDEDDD